MADLLAQSMQHAGRLSSSSWRGLWFLAVSLLLGSASRADRLDQDVDSIAVAIQEILAEIREDPQSGPTYVRLGEAYHARGNLSASRAALEQGLRLGCDSADSVHVELLLTEIALQHGRTHEAYRRLTVLVRKDAAPTGAMARLAQFQWEDHFREEALSLGAEAAARAPDDPEIRRWLAERWKELGRFDIARSLRRCLASGDDRTDEDLFQYAYLSHRLEDHQSAVDSYLGLLEHNPTHPQANFNLALLVVAVGDTSQAIDRLEAAIRGDRSLLQAYLELGAIYLQQGQIDRARTTYMRLRMSGDPDSTLDAAVEEILEGLPVVGTR